MATPPYRYVGRRPLHGEKPVRRRGHRSLIILPLLIVIAAAVVFGVTRNNAGDVKADQTNNRQTAQTSTKSAASQQASGATAQSGSTKPASTECTKNSSGQLVLVSISQRHMWACDGSTQLYDSAVVTGMENLPADLTPTGTYHIYGKYVNTYLKGSDSTGSWNDYVHYWMPWLHNQYGSYGFHDATWRADDDFGNISPYSSNASHGCVELPLATAKWLYNWAVIGTTVTIES